MVFLGVVLVGLRATCLEIWTIPSDDTLFNASIAPTLGAGDVVVLWRRGTPSFGDLVRCADPEAQGRYVIGRILGEPGDHVVADGVSVSLNTKTVPTMVACAPPKVTVADPQTGNPIELFCDIEELGGGSYPRLRPPSADARAKVTTADVTAGNVFLVSDDRYFHDDSRDFGQIPKSTCEERIVYRFWSQRGWFDQEKRLTYIP